jgi:hypothetical protein
MVLASAFNLEFGLEVVVVVGFNEVSRPKVYLSLALMS